MKIDYLKLVDTSSTDGSLSTLSTDSGWTDCIDTHWGGYFNKYLNKKRIENVSFWPLWLHEEPCVSWWTETSFEQIFNQTDFDRVILLAKDDPERVRVLTEAWGYCSMPLPEPGAKC